MASHLKQARYRTEHLALLAALRFVPTLGRRTAARFSRVLGAVFYRLDARGRAVADANLRVAFRGALSVQQRRRIARESIQSFARTFVDLFWSPNLTLETWRKYMDGSGAENLRRKGAAGAGPIFLVQHYGNWEWLSFYAGFTGCAAKVVAQEFKNPLLGPEFDRLRALSGHEIIGRKGAMLRLVKHLKQGLGVAVLADLTVPPAESSVVIDSFGLKKCVSSLPAAFHRRLGCELVPSRAVHLPDGRCSLCIDPPLTIRPDAGEVEISQQCWDVFEPHLRAQPEQWLWSYKHWRYLPADADPADYPFYANRSKAFDKKLRGQKD